MDAELAAAHAASGEKVGRAAALDIIKKMTRQAFNGEDQNLRDIFTAKADAQESPAAATDDLVTSTPEQFDK